MRLIVFLILMCFCSALKSQDIREEQSNEGITEFTISDKESITRLENLPNKVSINKFITHLPKEIGKAKNLTEISIKSPKLKTLPITLCNCQKLTYVGIKAKDCTLPPELKACLDIIKIQKL